MTLQQRVMAWHRSLAQITGAMSYRMVKKVASRSEMLLWAVTLRAIAMELENEARSDR